MTLLKILRDKWRYKMIKLISKGVYYRGGKLVRAKGVDNNAKKGSMAYKIL